MRPFLQKLLQRMRIRRTCSPGEFEELFRRFRGIMDSNTAALEIITDMGEILGGDYIFDVQYVHRSLEQLESHIQHSLTLFDEMTGSRHQALGSVYGRIDSEVRQVLEGTERVTGELALNLEQVDGSMTASVGGKMANLADVKRSLPLAVPEGFVITAAGFDAYMRHNKVFEKVGPPQERRDGTMAWYAEVAEIVRQGETPGELRDALAQAVKRLRGKSTALAVRSSAGDEDGDHSFAGQFGTVLGVPLELGALERAYRKVIASLFSEKAAVYQQRFGYDPLRMKMAVGVLAMVDATASGVLFTANPADGSSRMVISSAWGLGTSVVDGTTDVDRVIADRSGAVLEEQIGSKETMSLLETRGGVMEQKTPDDQRKLRSITTEQMRTLVQAGVLLEERFHRTQDVEWAIDIHGNLVILQSRPLKISAGPASSDTHPAAAAGRIVFRNPGIVVQRGVAIGTVHVVKNEREIDEAPRGAVVVVKHDTPLLVRAMPRIAAIITDTGSLTSHMASLAREFRVPTGVNTGDATKVLAALGEVTVVFGEDVQVTPGRDGKAIAAAPEQVVPMDDLYEFRQKRYILRHIAPLNLVDPFRDDFSPGGCRTLHDILRFIHEKAVSNLIDAAGFGTRFSGAVKLDLTIPAGMTVIDIGGGLSGMDGSGHATVDQIASLPFQAVVRGMVHPGAWRSEAVPLSAGDFLASMFHAPDLVSESDRQMGANVAVISREYLNLNIKFGYHYTILDSYMSDTPRSNHIYFRFAGGATELTKRSRRLQLIERILQEHGFRISTRGDLLIGRLSGVGNEEMDAVLDQVGRLLSFTRQMDAVLSSDEDVGLYAENFHRGLYGASKPQG